MHPIAQHIFGYISIISKEDFLLVYSDLEFLQVPVCSNVLMTRYTLLIMSVMALMDRICSVTGEEVFTFYRGTIPVISQSCSMYPDTAIIKYYYA